MTHNNDLLYDAVIAGAGGGSLNGWLIRSSSGFYAPFASQIDILATAIDSQIPTINNGPSVSQVNLLQSITQSVLTGRYPVSTVPDTYAEIAIAIAAVYIELSSLLSNLPVIQTTSFGTPVAIGTINTAGEADTFARSDHIHQWIYSTFTAAYKKNWAETDWYIDKNTGNDNNTGTSVLAPIKTGVELLRRLGPYAIWSASVTIHILENGAEDGIVLRGYIPAQCHIDVIGSTTILVTDTLSSYLPVDPSTPEATLITGTVVTDYTNYAFKRIRVTGGARAGDILWIACANPHNAGVNIARVSTPCFFYLGGTSSVVSTRPLVAGDPYAIESLPSVPSITVHIDGPYSAIDNYSSVAQRQLSVQSINVTSLNINQPTNNWISTIVWGCQHCHWTFAGNDMNLMGTDTSIYGGYFTVVQPASNAKFLRVKGSANYSLFGGPNMKALFISGDVKLNFAVLQNCYIEGAADSSLKSSPPVRFSGYSIGIFDVNESTYGGGATASIACSVARGDIYHLYGNGNAGFGIGIVNGAILSLMGTINLQGTVSNGKLQAAPTVPLTLPQLLQPNDYAQKGTASLLLGSVTITILWYDNTIQKVIVSHAVFGGTPGILSVQQLSSTQFTITSSSPLDTSTINWSISPLGRNIFITTS